MLHNVIFLISVGGDHAFSVFVLRLDLRCLDRLNLVLLDDQVEHLGVGAHDHKLKVNDGGLGHLDLLEVISLVAHQKMGTQVTHNVLAQMVPLQIHSLRFNLHFFGLRLRFVFLSVLLHALEVIRHDEGAN